MLPPDDRFAIGNTTVHPYRTICHVTSYFPGGGVAQGTAVMVGPKHALTAGHVVFDVDSNQWADSVYVEPGYDEGWQPFGGFSAVSTYTLTPYIDYGDSNYDFGVLEFGSAVGNTTGYLGYAVLSNGELNGTTVNTAGYPGDLFDGERMYGASGTIDSVSSRQVYYKGTMDTAGGQSGSPVWIFDGEDRFVVAIHTFGTATKNGGVRFTEDLFDLVEYLQDPVGPTPEEPGTATLDVYLGKCMLKEYEPQGLDGAKVKASYFHNSSAPDSVFDPVGDGIDIRLLSAGQEAFILSIPGGNGNWKEKPGRSAVWKGNLGDVRVNLKINLRRNSIVARFDWFDFEVPIENPIGVSLTSGNDYGVKAIPWYLKKPWLWVF